MEDLKRVWKIKRNRYKLSFCWIFRKAVDEFESFCEENDLKFIFSYAIILKKMIEIGKIYVKITKSRG